MVGARCLPSARRSSVAIRSAHRTGGIVEVHNPEASEEHARRGSFTSCPRIGRAISAVLRQRSLVAPVGAWRPLGAAICARKPPFLQQAPSLVPARLGALWLSVGNFWRQMPALLPPHPQARTSCRYSTAYFCTFLVLLPERGGLGSTSSLESDPLCVFRSGRFAGNARPGNQAEATAPTPSKVRGTPSRAA
jgi:hypothetical protein